MILLLLLLRLARNMSQTLDCVSHRLPELITLEACVLKSYPHLQNRGVPVHTKEAQ